jgi:predicted RND superfamily exporter protein
MEALFAPLTVFVGFAALAAPSVYFAKRRGRSMVLWGALGIALPLISVLLLVLAGDKKDAAAY